MRGDGAVRGLVGGAGVLVGLWGVWLFRDQVGGDTEDLVSALLWLAGGVVLHDFVLVPLVLLLGLVATRVLSPAWRAAAAGGLVVLGSVTLVAVPMLGRFGAKADNPTLLDRSYGTGWLLLVALVVVGVVVTGLRRRRREK